MKKNRNVFVSLLLFQVVLLLTVGLGQFGVPAVSAAPVDRGLQGRCIQHKRIPSFVNSRQLAAKGFFFDLLGSGSVSYNRGDGYRYASLHLGTDFSGNPAASRITEIDDELPVGERVKCWQPTATRNVVAEFTVRFAEATNPPGLTENILLWNAPFSPEGNMPMTAVGVSRNQLFPGYVATVAQDLVFGPVPAGFIDVGFMPPWLDPTDWHDVRLTVGQHDILVEVAQGEHDYTVVLATTVPEPMEPLGFEFSIDNEAFPGIHVPVTVPDTLDVAYFDIRLD